MNEAKTLSMRDQLIGMLSRKKLTDDILTSVADNIAVTLIKDALQSANSEQRLAACKAIFEIVDGPAEGSYPVMRQSQAGPSESLPNGSPFDSKYFRGTCSEPVA